ncbi:hypothetical protein [Candidatus Poriferisocius sp.]|uniref:hypothetical protein n=1 Tax=Candidatus Poriferisocius sp. TaxID=3101276 RepID=UPI003B025E90
MAEDILGQIIVGALIVLIGGVFLYLFKQTMNGLRSEMNGLRSEMNLRFDAIDKRFETIDKRFETIEGKLDALSTRVGGLETDVALLVDRAGVRDRLAERYPATESKVEAGV